MNLVYFLDEVFCLIVLIGLSGDDGGEGWRVVLIIFVVLFIFGEKM